MGIEVEASDGQVPPPLLICFRSYHSQIYLLRPLLQNLAVAGFLQILFNPGLLSAANYASSVVGASPSSRWRATACTRPQV
jgi:hypothetical protein